MHFYLYQPRSALAALHFQSQTFFPDASVKKSDPSSLTRTTKLSWKWKKKSFQIVKDNHNLAFPCSPIRSVLYLAFWLLHLLHRAATLKQRMLQKFFSLSVCLIDLLWFATFPNLFYSVVKIVKILRLVHNHWRRDKMINE